jgi:hypothetical protein
MVFVTYLSNQEEALNAYHFIASLRRFGGEWRNSPVWALVASPDLGDQVAFTGAEVYPLEIDLPRYPFAAKTAACAQSEALAGGDFSSLVWFNPEALILRPPELLDLDQPAPVDAALRPVHLRNIGSPAGAPLDHFWSGIYQAAGLHDTTDTVESFVDGQVIRPYFNTHIFAVRPAAGIMQAWWSLFQSLIADQSFQTLACADPLPRIFLHQAVLSALLTCRLPQARLRLLPPEYSYPLHLHQQIPSKKRPARLDDLVCPVYEDAFQYPDTLNGLDAGPELTTWLSRK